MRPVILLLLFLLCGCRSRQSETLSIAGSRDSCTVTTGETASGLFEFLSMAEELDLSGITIDFFPPDSSGEPSSPAPRTLRIEKLHRATTELALRDSTTATSRTDSTGVSLTSSLESSSRPTPDRSTVRLVALCIVLAIPATCFIIYKFQS